MRVVLLIDNPQVAGSSCTSAAGNPMPTGARTARAADAYGCDGGTFPVAVGEIVSLSGHPVTL